MIRAGDLVTALAGAGLLGAMMLTAPDYNSVIRPFVSKAGPQGWGSTRLFQGRFDDWRTASVIAGGDGPLTTQGVFLVVDMTLRGRGESTTIAAAWIGASGRRYAATRRLRGAPRLLDGLWLQPGLDSRGTAVFELPPDEIAGGHCC